MSEEAKERLRAEDEARAGPADNLDGAVQPVRQVSSTASNATLGLTHHPKTQPIALAFAELQEFHLDILHLFAANSFSLHAIGNPQTRLFFQRWIPGPKLPTQQALGGRVLRAAVKDSKDRMKAAVDGKLAIGISDGWKSARKALLACMVDVDYKVSSCIWASSFYLCPFAQAYTIKVVDISALPKTAENHLKVVKSVIEFCESNLNVKIIGWVSDAGGDSRAMRVRLGKERPDLILLDCWAHQVNGTFINLYA